MKRSTQVNLARYRKSWRYFSIAPITAAVLAGCSGDPETKAVIYKSLDDCQSENPTRAEQCEIAYVNALLEAQRTAPKYASIEDCEADFGKEACVSMANAGLPQASASSNQSWFMPAMAGFMFARMLNDRRYYSQPMYYSSVPSSRYYDTWSSADGHRYGSSKGSARTVTVTSRDLEPKPTVARTISRGGFGSTAQARSSWSSSNRSSASNSRSSSRSSWSSSRSSSRGWGG
uniref:DUF1190 family protein n=1 Tax=Thaumasiovibrio occultus TaxID=1891184 RepID=UPI000B36457B|nr:DUF1190 family protein [Thaumasiovibrio occultus]